MRRELLRSDNSNIRQYVWTRNSSIPPVKLGDLLINRFTSSHITAQMGTNDASYKTNLLRILWQNTDENSIRPHTHLTYDRVHGNTGHACISIGNLIGRATIRKSWILARKLILLRLRLATMSNTARGSSITQQDMTDVRSAVELADGTASVRMYQIKRMSTTHESSSYMVDNA